jgi:hypothetical protein
MIGTGDGTGRGGTATVTSGRIIGGRNITAGRLRLPSGDGDGISTVATGLSGAISDLRRDADIASTMKTGTSAGTLVHLRAAVGILTKTRTAGISARLPVMDAGSTMTIAGKIIVTAGIEIGSALTSAAPRAMRIAERTAMMQTWGLNWNAS